MTDNLSPLRIDSHAWTTTTATGAESEYQGLKISIFKTKVMVENDVPMNVNVAHIENVESLGERYNITREKNQDKEIQRKATTGWTAFGNHSFKSNVGTVL